MPASVLDNFSILLLKCDGTRAETRIRLSAKRTCPFKSAGASVQSTTGSQGVRIGGSNAGYTMFRGSVKSTGYPLHSPVSPSLPKPCVNVCHHISTGRYKSAYLRRFRGIFPSYCSSITDNEVTKCRTSHAVLIQARKVLAEFMYAPTVVQRDEAFENQWFRRIFTLFDLCA
jgi:hypothetical protein